jgi:hypothetical protein
MPSTGSTILQPYMGRRTRRLFTPTTSKEERDGGHKLLADITTAHYDRQGGYHVSMGMGNVVFGSRFNFYGE